MTWPCPCVEMDDLEWRLRYGLPSRSDHLVAAGIIGAYKQMVGDTQKKRQMVIRELRQGPNVPSDNVNPAEKPQR